LARSFGVAPTIDLPFTCSCDNRCDRVALRSLQWHHERQRAPGPSMCVIEACRAVTPVCARRREVVNHQALSLAPYSWASRSRRAALRLAASYACTYARCVVPTSEWPSRALTSSMSQPDAMSAEPWEWRRLWKVGAGSTTAQRAQPTRVRTSALGHEGTGSRGPVGVKLRGLHRVRVSRGCPGRRGTFGGGLLMNYVKPGKREARAPARR
jgi:hypothetical protein